MPNAKPKKIEIARFKVLNDIGMTPNAIGKQTDRDPKTVRKYLSSEVYQDNTEIQELVYRIKENELSDLYMIGAKARNRLNELLDEGKTKAIETTAILDRTFQQRRLLEGQATEITDNLDTVRLLKEMMRRLQERKRVLERINE